MKTIYQNVQISGEKGDLSHLIGCLLAGVIRSKLIPFQLDHPVGVGWGVQGPYFGKTWLYNTCSLLKCSKFATKTLRFWPKCALQSTFSVNLPTKVCSWFPHFVEVYALEIGGFNFPKILKLLAPWIWPTFRALQKESSFLRSFSFFRSSLFLGLLSFLALPSF